MTEKISQLVDSELDAADRRALMDKLVGDRHAQSRWRKYHLIGCVIRDEVTVVGKDLSPEIMERLEGEPTVLAPRKPEPGKRSAREANSEVWKSAGLFAMAASLALVAVVTLSPVQESDRSLEVAATSPVPDSGEMTQFAQEFDEMLAEHGEFTASPGLNGLIAYAKLVSNQKVEQ